MVTRPKNPVASKDEPTQFLSVINMLEDKVWSYSWRSNVGVWTLVCRLAAPTQDKVQTLRRACGQPAWLSVQPLSSPSSLVFW